MSTRKDRIADPEYDRRDRVNYAEGVLLDARDFEDEQLYHRATSARALQYLFGTGTVAGLEVTYNPATGEIEVAPGLAIDPLGRLIELPRTWCLVVEDWFDAQRDEDLARSWIDEGAGPVLVADVFIRFVACGRGKTPSFATGPFDALDAVTPSRVRDGFELALVVRPETERRREDLAAGADPREIPLPSTEAEAAALVDLPGAAFVTQMRQRILSAWREGTQHWTDDRPPALVEHLEWRTLVDEVDPTAVGQDPTSVLLARTTIPVTAPAAGGPPGFVSAAFAPANFVRRFVYCPGVLTRIP
ncbi:MAG: hypothetical protein AAF799_14805 [Myxococcota bacterium]